MKFKPAIALAFAALLTVATVGAVALPAFAQTPIDTDPLDDRSKRRLDNMEKVVRELRAIVFQGRDSGKPVVVQSAESETQLADLTEKMNDLQQALTQLNATNESLAHDLDQTKKALTRSQSDNAALIERLAGLEKRLGELETAQAQAQQAADTTQQAEAAMADAASPDEAFAKAKGFMDSGDYDSAEAAFAAFVRQYGDSPRAAEGSYWLGKTLSVRNANADAAQAFIAAIRGWPKTAWAPDAVLELSRSLVALGKPQDACQTLAQLAKYYPKAPPVVTAQAAKVRTQAHCTV
ncbi:tol-pal system protein YbgF [Caulobacter ginsengisoli]|uniref:Cell division coordinator CpoB n=1 Tax=Caulobacter ginsengisoli TaxID=400775 RepID=A0ABU0IW05_9CAUL|nr:tol-pal system protein YbgF [Caulobacter ginsengisoli]MDQ0465107.1 tol-pal system protein YbgF [Caulobacter ginsengisoli]